MFNKRLYKMVIFFVVSAVWATPFVFGENALTKANETEIRNELETLKQKVQQLESLLQQYQQKETVKPEKEVSNQQIQDLEQQVKILQRNRELDLEEATAKTATQPKLTADKKGFSLSSPNGDFLLKLRGYVQADSRFYLDDDTNSLDDTFTLRRVRPILEGTLWDNYDFRVMTDFGGGSVSLQDAYLNIHYWPEAQLQVGKFKPPVGLERLESGSSILFIERGFPTALVPNRDVGAQLQGDLIDGRLSYAVGIFNGVADGASGDANVGDGFDFAGRIFAHPFLKSEVEALKGFGVGVAGTYGDQNGALNAYRTEGQAKFVQFESDALANGNHTRLSPQGYYYWGPFGLLGEYVLSSQEIDRKGVFDEVDNEAWQVQASYVLTGESASYKGLKPKKPLNFSTGDWGAFEVAARYGELSVDDDVFTLGYAKNTLSAKEAEDYALGLNWYFNDNALFKVNFVHTEFSGGSTTGDRDDENAILTRFQISF